MAGIRRFWALMAVLATIALTSYTVDAILETESELNFEAHAITGNVIAASETLEEEGVVGMVDKAANWMAGE